MATITGSFSSNSNNLQPYIEYSYTQNKSTLSTTITAKLYVKKLTSYGNTWDSSTPYSLSIGGTSVSSGSKSVDMRNVSVNSSVLVTSGSRTIKHNSDGTLKATLSGVVDWTGSNPGKGTVSKSITFPTIVVNTAPYWGSGTYVTIKENDNNGRTISAASSSDSSPRFAESIEKLYISWPAALDKESTSEMIYRLYAEVNDGSWTKIYEGTGRSYTHTIGKGNQNYSYDYYVKAVDSGGLITDANLNAAQVRKNKFTPATFTVSGSIKHSSSNQTITINRTNATNVYTTGQSISYLLSAKIGSTTVTVNKSNASGNLVIVADGASVTSITTPYILLSDIRNAVKGSSYNGTLTLTMKSSNSWGSSGTYSRDIPVDLRVNPTVGAATSLNASSYYTINSVKYLVPARKKVRLDWGACSDPNGTPITYRVEQSKDNGATWSTLSSSVSTNTYSFNLSVSGKPTYKWRVYAKNGYGRESLIGGIPGGVLYKYDPPTVSITTVSRTVNSFTVNFTTGFSSEIPGNSIISRKITYGSTTSGNLTTNSATLTGLSEGSTGTYYIAVEDAFYSSIFGITSPSKATGSVSQFYPMLSIRNNGVGIGVTPDGSAKLQVGGDIKASGEIYAKNTSKVYHSGYRPNVYDLNVSSGTSDINGYNPTRIWTTKSGNTAANRPADHVTIVNIGEGSNSNFQLASSYSTTPRVYVRGRHDLSGTYHAWATIYTSLNKPSAADVGAVPTSRTVNNKALSANISLSAGDVGAVPTSRTVNGKALSANISITAGDVGALPIGGGTLTGNLTAPNVYLTNNSSSALRAKDTGGTNRVLAYITDSNNNSFGRGMYDASLGGTYIYGHNNASFVCHAGDGKGYEVNWEGASTTATPKEYFPTFRPSDAGKARLGTSSYKWHSIWAVSTTINSNSDRRLKEDIKPIDERYERFFMDLEAVNYRLKQYDDHRVHNGFIAQDVEAALLKNGLGYDDLSALTKNMPEDENNLPIFYNADGELDYEYGLGYGEFTALNTHMIQKCFRHIAALEKENLEMKKEIEIMKGKLI